MSILEDPEEMRRSGYRVVDAIVERLTELGHDKAFQTAPRNVTEALLDGPPPEEGRDLDPLL
ncbi:MAG: L-2,4-diaminobutyrate decarboxylase, partial [Acidobacteria bacterium]|nr:L-2,4-diaminobutyrate decarboxylase [Acidobacteriota bacterium]